MLGVITNNYITYIVSAHFFLGDALKRVKDYEVKNEVTATEVHC